MFWLGRRIIKLTKWKKGNVFSVYFKRIQFAVFEFLEREVKLIKDTVECIWKTDVTE